MVSWLAAFIAAIVAAIAFFQWMTAREKVLLDLFDKRYAVYDELRAMVGHFQGAGALGLPELGKFQSAKDRAKYLFGPEVSTFLEARYTDLIAAGIAFKNPQGGAEEQEKSLARITRLTDFFKDLDRLAAPYMNHQQKALKMPWQ